ncbi:MAG: calcium/sodium antiporter [Candidatus Dojkabacteria bacterium]
MTDLIILLASLALVIFSANILIEGASSVAKRFKVSDLVIGLTIVAFGTSLPEMVVSILAGVKGNAELTVGNAIGSNITNILLILGLTSIIYPVKIRNNTIWKEIPLSLLAALVAGIVANDMIFDNLVENSILRSEGLVLIGFFIIYLYYTFEVARTGEKEEEEPVRVMSIPRALIFIAGGILGLVIGGEFSVSSASTLAKAAGLSDAIIGLTVIAIGTSLPELTTSVIAAFKKKADVAVGNIVGSNIFNIFWILGLSSTLSPIVIESDLRIDFLFLILATILMFISLFTFKKRRIDRKEGLFFVLLYVVYIAINIARVV